MSIVSRHGRRGSRVKDAVRVVFTFRTDVVSAVCEKSVHLERITGKGPKVRGR